jgi:hypothetical protein
MIAVSGPGFVVIVISIGLFTDLMKDTENCLCGHTFLVAGFVKVFSTVSFSSYGLSYTFERLYLVVESFISFA